MTAPDLEPTLPYPPPWQDLATLARHICTGEATIERWVKLGQFPAPRKVHGKNLWRWKDVEKHLAGDTVERAASPDQQAEDIRNATRSAASRHN